MIIEYEVKQEPCGRHDFEIEYPRGFLGFGGTDFYTVRILTRKDKIKLSKKDVQSIGERILENKPLWAEIKSKKGFTHKTVLSDYPKSDIYIKDHQFKKKEDEANKND